MNYGLSLSLFPDYNRGSTDPQTSKQWPRPVPIRRHTNLHNRIAKILAAREIHRVVVRSRVVARVRGPGCGELGGLSPGWGDADAASEGVGWLGDWLSSKLGRGIWVPPGEDAFVPSGWAG